MDLLNVFQTMEKYEDDLDSYRAPEAPYPKNAYTDTPINNVVNDFEKFNHSTMYYNLDGYISPHSYMNWGSNSEIVTSIIEDCKVPAFLDRLDPNQIFTPDMAELRKLASDQNKIVKMFERRLMESLTSQGKVGLDESDIEAMQALTAARSAITSINKEKTGIKTKIAELKIKQQSLANGSAGGNGGTGNATAQNPYAARSIMDNIFELSMRNNPPQSSTVDFPVPEVDPSSIETEEISSGDTTMTELEILQPKTYVVVDSNGDPRSAEYLTRDQNMNEITNYPNPTKPIVDVDLNTGDATNEIGQHFQIEIREKDKFVDIDKV